jgi:hypothetical protein
MSSSNVKRGYLLLELLQLRNTKRYETFLPKFLSKDIEGTFYLDHKESSVEKRNELVYGDIVEVLFDHEL